MGRRFHPFPITPPSLLCGVAGTPPLPLLINESTYVLEHHHDDIESIDIGAFRGCIFTSFRVPNLITVIPDSMLWNCTSMFSVEIPLTVTEIKDYAFRYCHCLRNVALPPDAVLGDDIFNLQ